jgi:hypothetical protein
LWAHVESHEWGLPLVIFLAGLVVIATVFVFIPLALGVRYDIKPATRKQSPS